ncbi:MAG TPA: ABC transporter permease [Casimicrobiaceae bacterium]|nr:ABC transporter permease [Casimicrobiaceae bacterium]
MASTPIAVSRAPVARPDDQPSAIARFFLSPVGLITARVGLIVLLLVAWEGASGRLVSKYWLSSPSAIAAKLWSWIADGSLWLHLHATLLEMGLGYVIGCIAGVVVGLILGFLPTVYRVVMPFLGGLYCLPKIALAPLFVIVLGIDLGSKVALVGITVFFLILYSTLDGIHDIDRDLVQSMRLMGATRREVSIKVLIPGCLRWVFTGMRIAVRYAFTAAVLGEVIAANRGVGYLVEANAGQFNSTGVFAAVLVLVACSLTFSELLTRFEASTSKGRSGL